jgi:O-antigen/teichoic acid export membrane protein
MIFSAIPRDWRRLALVLGGEAMQSGLHFALNLALMALMPAREYGAFAFTLVLGGVGLVYIRSLTAVPASAYIGRARSDRFAGFCEGAFGAAALTLCVGVAVAGGLVLFWSDGPALSGGAMVGMWSLRSHLRTIGYARRRPAAVIAGDAAFALTGALASGLTLRFAADPLQGVLIALAFANGVGAAALSLARGAAPRFDFGARARGFYLGLSRRLAWSLYSVTATILQGQGVAFLVVGFAGPAAFAPLAAMLAFFAPLRIFALSLSNMLQPEIARLAANGDDAGWRETRGLWTLRAGLIALAYGELGLVVLPRLHLKSVEHQPVAFIALLAWALYAIVLVYLLPRILLEARMRFREIAVITTAGAAVSLAATAILLKVTAPGYAILGATLGEGVAAAGTWMVAARPLTQRRPAPLRVPVQNSAPVAGATCEAEPLA